MNRKTRCKSLVVAAALLALAAVAAGCGGANPVPDRHRGGGHGAQSAWTPTRTGPTWSVNVHRSAGDRCGRGAQSELAQHKAGAETKLAEAEMTARIRAAPSAFPRRSRRWLLLAPWRTPRTNL
jgi:hypothetical protein